MYGIGVFLTPDLIMGRMDNRVNDPFTKVAVLSGAHTNFVLISCVFCPILLQMLSISK